MRLKANQKLALAQLIAHNVFHTEQAHKVWNFASQAIAAHQDDVREAAQATFCHQLTAREWSDVTLLALPLVDFVMHIRGTFSVAKAAYPGLDARIG